MEHKDLSERELRLKSRNNQKELGVGYKPKSRKKKGESKQSLLKDTPNISDLFIDPSQNVFKMASNLNTIPEEELEKIRDLLSTLNINSLADAIKHKDEYNDMFKKLQQGPYAHGLKVEDEEESPYEDDEEQEPDGKGSKGYSGSKKSVLKTENRQTGEENNNQPAKTSGFKQASFNGGGVSGRKWRIPEMKVPIFSGRERDKLDDWYEQVTRCFKINEVPRNMWVLYIGSYLSDIGLSQYRTIIKQYPNITWAKFAQLFWDAFVCEDLQTTLRKKLLSLNQTSTFQNYLNDFERLMSRVENMSEIDKIHAFKRGLKNKTLSFVSINSPITLKEAIRLATVYEINNFSQNSKEQLHAKTAAMMKHERFKKSRNYKFNDYKKKDIKNTKCYNCNELGHIAKYCNKPRKNTQKTSKKAYVKLSSGRSEVDQDQQHQQHQQQQQLNKKEKNSELRQLKNGNNEHESYSINGSRLTAYVSIFKSSTNPNLLKTNGTLRNKQVSVILDTAATACIMSEKLFNSLNLKLEYLGRTSRWI